MKHIPNWKDIVEYFLNLMPQASVTINTHHIRVAMPYSFTKTMWAHDAQTRYVWPPKEDRESPVAKQLIQNAEAKFPNVTVTWESHKNVRITAKK
jgi:hypothetical protein